MDLNPETLDQAKRGVASAIEELREKHVSVWTHEQLKALNTFRKLRTQTMNNEKVAVIWNGPLRRSNYSKPEPATALYAQIINEDYTLLKVRFNDGSEQSWIVMQEDGEAVCNATDWTNPKRKDELSERTPKQRDWLERQKKRRELGLRSKPNRSSRFRSMSLPLRLDERLDECQTHRDTTKRFEGGE